MTETSAAPLNGRASRLTIPIVRFHSLAGLLLLAAAIRLPLAFWPNVLHPDEIFQCLEPAWRMLGHDGIVSWEWRYGMRGWLLPSLMAGPVGLGDWVAPGGTGAFVVPRLVAALASLSIVASAWSLGARVSRTHAIVAAFVAAIWFELVSFAPHRLSEPLATAVILPAALLLTHASLSQRHLAVGGALLALAFVFRFQYAPAIAVLALGACWRHWRNLIPLVAGASIGLVFGGVADAAHGAVPFAWLIANVQQNLLHDRAAEFGVTPAITYLYSFWMMWSVALVLLLFAIWQGWRHAPLLLATAVANIAVHSLIGHKEYRFIFLSVALFIIIAALGSADWIQWLRANRAWRRWALPVVAGGVGADLGGACGDRYDAGQLDARHGCGATGGRITRRSGALRSRALQHAFPPASGAGPIGRPVAALRAPPCRSGRKRRPRGRSKESRAGVQPHPLATGLGNGSSGGLFTTRLRQRRRSRCVYLRAKRRLRRGDRGAICPQ
ncbi:MAG TPA: 4-amino-4-deoxy-L-arabinose transferase [Bradyrhizobium sp.]